MRINHLRYLSFALLLVFISSSEAQSSKPVNWTFSLKKVADKEYDLIFKAEIRKGLHIYSQHIGDGGPIPTSFIFNNDPNYSRTDSVIEKCIPTKTHDKMFDMDLLYFEDSAIFVQHIKVIGKTNTVTGTLEYMACDNRKCFPPQKVDYAFKLPE
jgi:thiol:disulfide interchange protein DsbD